MALHTLSSPKLTALVDNATAQLVGLERFGRNFMHGGGNPAADRPGDHDGWKNSSIVMFPVVGPVKENRLRIEENEYALGQHGVSRYLPWETLSVSDSEILLRQRYAAGTPVKNDKLSEPISLPYTFELLLHYGVYSDACMMDVTIRNLGSEPMQYMIGWHPAFRLFGADGMPEGLVHSGGSPVSIAQIREASKTGAYKITPEALVIYSNDQYQVDFHSNMGAMMLWSPEGSSLLCIEPTTDLPVIGGIAQFGKDARTLQAGETARYYASIMIQRPTSVPSGP